MDKLEEVKKILNRLNEDDRYDESVIDMDAREICQLFEPKPNESRGLTWRLTCYGP